MVSAETHRAPSAERIGMNVSEGGALAQPLATTIAATAMARVAAARDRRSKRRFRTSNVIGVSFDGSVVTTVGRRRERRMTIA